MKLSQFNAFVPNGDMVVAYNTLSNHFMGLNPELHELIQSGAAHDQLDELADYHPEFYNALVDGGFLVETEKDEVQVVKDMVEKIDKNDVHYTLTINPTMNCNFKCWYCYETHIKGSKMVVSVLDRVHALVENHIRELTSLENYRISFFGGEPLLNYRDVVLPILAHAVPRLKEAGIDVHVTFTSNGYLVNQSMIDDLKAYASPFFQITLDGNREMHDTIRFINKKKGSYDQIIENVRLLLRNEVTVLLRINYTKKTLLGITDIIPDLEVLTMEERKFLQVDFHQVWQDGEVLDDLVVDVMDAFREADLFASAPFSFPDNVVNSCYGDKKNSAVINYNGDVFKCTARDFTTKNREGYLTEEGTIVWENEKDVFRLNSKFRNKPCLSCFMLPICNGGCSQHAVERGGIVDYCVYNFDEERKLKLVLDKFNYKYGHN